MRLDRAIHIDRHKHQASMLYQQKLKLEQISGGFRLITIPFEKHFIGRFFGSYVKFEGSIRPTIALHLKKFYAVKTGDFHQF